MRAVLAAVLACGACTDGAASDPGLDSMLQVRHAQFRPGPFPAATGGPEAVQVNPARAIAVVGQFVDNTLKGVLGADAQGAVFGIEGYDGAWIVAASTPDFESPELPTAKASFALALDFPPGPFTVRMAALGASGIGEPVTTALVAAAEPELVTPLVVQLEWSGRADLDLHVVDPDGNEAWSDEPNTHKPPGPGQPPDGPYDYRNGGRLDHDANSSCSREVRPRERIAWTYQDPALAGSYTYTPPPRGTYTVRVDARYLCGDAAAAWTATAYTRTGDEPSQLHLLGGATGVLVEDDTEQPHGRGAGVLAFRFEL